jgi:thioredoxin-like negative regulator of GroEL
MRRDAPTDQRFNSRATGKATFVASVLQTEPVARSHERPRLVFFFSPQSGRCRRVEGFIAQVLQRRRNHDTFELIRVPVDKRPDIAEKFGIDELPTICVVQDRKLRTRIVAPRGCRELELELGEWLQ